MRLGMTSRCVRPGPRVIQLLSRIHEFQNTCNPRGAQPQGTSRRGDDAHLPDLDVCFSRSGPTGPFDYSRSGNPTRKALESCLAQLEGGTAGFAFATGMAAETTFLMMFSSGDNIVVHDDLYGGTYRLFESVFATKQIRAQYVDLRNIPKLRSALAAGPKAVWIETPTNPLMNLVDIRAVSDLAAIRNEPVEGI